MKRQRTIVSIVVLLAALGAGMPAAALAGAPLLGGYGGPGAGAQTILGATLVNGSAGSSGGNPGNPGGGVGSGAASPAGGAPASGSATSSAAAGGASDRGRAARSAGAAGLAAATYPRAVGANHHSSHLGATTAVTTSALGTSWFSGADLLALLLASGALALVAAATVRLTRPEHH